MFYQVTFRQLLILIVQSTVNNAAVSAAIYIKKELGRQPCF